MHQPFFLPLGLSFCSSLSFPAGFVNGDMTLALTRN